MANFVNISNYHINTDAIKYYTTSRSEAYTDRGAIVSYNLTICFINDDKLNLSSRDINEIKQWVTALDCAESAAII